MKGLLLKDLYMMVKYCKAYLLVSVVFMAVSLFSDGNMFFCVYPCLLAGMIPVALLAYDEQSRWNVYCGGLPYSRAQLVSAKYLIGLLAQAAALLLIGIAQAVRLHLAGGFSPVEFLSLMGALLALSCLAPAISLPLMFKLGVEKGRLVYLITVGIMVAATMVTVQVVDPQALVNGWSLPGKGALPIICAAAVAAYILSWRLSIGLYERREVK